MFSLRNDYSRTLNNVIISKCIQITKEGLFFVCLQIVTFPNVKEKPKPKLIVHENLQHSSTQIYLLVFITLVLVMIKIESIQVDYALEPF